MMMKVILNGFKTSKKIIPTSSYLINKYIPESFEIQYLNFGKYNSDLYGAKYISCGPYRIGGIKSWSKYNAKYFSTLDDEFIIFSLDDFLLTKSLNMELFNSLFDKLKENKMIGIAQLGIGSNIHQKKYDLITDKIFNLGPNANYSVTTQWSIWRRKVLIDVLNHTNDPWDFELNGSVYFNKKNYIAIGSVPAALPYPDWSSLSNKNKDKISILGNKESDIKNLIKLGHLQEKDLILGQFKDNQFSYLNHKNDQTVVNESQEGYDKEYYLWALEQFKNS